MPDPVSIETLTTRIESLPADQLSDEISPLFTGFDRSILSKLVAAPDARPAFQVIDSIDSALQGISDEEDKSQIADNAIDAIRHGIEKRGDLHGVSELAERAYGLTRFIEATDTRAYSLMYLAGSMVKATTDRSGILARQAEPYLAEAAESVLGDNEDFYKASLVAQAMAVNDAHRIKHGEHIAETQTLSTFEELARIADAEPDYSSKFALKSTLAIRMAKAAGEVAAVQESTKLESDLADKADRQIYDIMALVAGKRYKVFRTANNIKKYTRLIDFGAKLAQAIDDGYDDASAPSPSQLLLIGGVEAVVENAGDYVSELKESLDHRFADKDRTDLHSHSSSVSTAAWRFVDVDFEATKRMLLVACNVEGLERSHGSSGWTIENTPHKITKHAAQRSDLRQAFELFSLADTLAHQDEAAYARTIEDNAKAFISFFNKYNDGPVDFSLDDIDRGFVNLAVDLVTDPKMTWPLRTLINFVKSDEMKTKISGKIDELNAKAAAAVEAKKERVTETEKLARQLI